MDDLEYIKFCLLCDIKPYVEIDVEMVQTLLEQSSSFSCAELMEARKTIVSEFVDKNSRQPTVDEMRNIQSSAYAMRALSDL